MLPAPEARAQSLGYRSILFDTGLTQPEAIALYESDGFECVTGFGHYADEPDSRAFVKAL